MIQDNFSHTNAAPISSPQDANLAAARLGGLLQFKTLAGESPETTDWAPFEAQLEYLKKTYPKTFETAELTLVDHSVLLVIEGKEKNKRPLLLIAHQDVVPVVPGTEADWTYPAFSGAVDEGYIWGRGALDMKDHLAAELEAVEYLLTEQGQPERSIVLAFGQDEETFQTGSLQLAQELERRDIYPAALIDEGDYSLHDLQAWGASGKALMVCVAEKGYADIKLRVKSSGGHSSEPFGGSSLEHLSRAIVKICDHDWGTSIPEPFLQFLQSIAPRIQYEKLSLTIAEISQLQGAARQAKLDALAQELKHNKIFHSYVCTTTAPTMISGSSTQPNVLPQDMSCVINFRMLPGVSVSDVFEGVKKLMADFDFEVEVELLAGESDGSVDYQFDESWLATLREVAADFFVDAEAGDPIEVLPSLVVGATDARNYERLGTTCLRFSPLLAEDEEIERGVHGTDERISIESYCQGIRFFTAFVQKCCYC